MKKFYMTLVAMFVAVAASAQVYVGGNVGLQVQITVMMTM